MTTLSYFEGPYIKKPPNILHGYDSLVEALLSTTCF